MLADIMCRKNDSWHCQLTVSVDNDGPCGVAFTVPHCLSPHSFAINIYSIWHEIVNMCGLDYAYWFIHTVQCCLQCVKVGECILRVVSVILPRWGKTCQVAQRLSQQDDTPGNRRVKSHRDILNKTTHQVTQTCQVTRRLSQQDNTPGNTDVSSHTETFSTGQHTR